MKYEPGPNPKVLLVTFIIFAVVLFSLYIFGMLAEVNGWLK